MKLQTRLGLIALFIIVGSNAFAFFFIGDTIHPLWTNQVCYYSPATPPTGECFTQTEYVSLSYLHIGGGMVCYTPPGNCSMQVRVSG